MPISVSSSAGSTRRDRSPAAIAPAVSPIVSSGRNPICTSHERERAGDERDPDRDQRLDREQPAERGVASRVSGTAITRVPAPGRGPTACTRKPLPPLEERAENVTEPTPPVVDPGSPAGNTGIAGLSGW